MVADPDTTGTACTITDVALAVVVFQFVPDVGVNVAVIEAPDKLEEPGLQSHVILPGPVIAPSKPEAHVSDPGNWKVIVPAKSAGMLVKVAVNVTGDGAVNDVSASLDAITKVPVPLPTVSATEGDAGESL